jgi:hypothetical protein
VVQPRSDLALVVLGSLRPGELERSRDVVARGDLGDDRAQPAPRRDQPDGGRDRRLPDAALPGDDEQLLGEQLAQSSPSQ